MNATPADTVSVAVPAHAAYLQLVRSVVASVAARANLTVDAIEDLTIAVDEACAQLIGLGGSTLRIAISATPGDVEIRCSTDGASGTWPPDDAERSLAGTVLRGLTDGVVWELDGAGAPTLRLTKRPAGSAAT